MSASRLTPRHVAAAATRPASRAAARGKGTHSGKAARHRERRQGTVAAALALTLAGTGMAVSFYARHSDPEHRSGVAVVQPIPPVATPGLPRFRLPAVHAARSPMLGRLAIRSTGLSVAELGGRWTRGTDTWHLPGAGLIAMRSGAAEYTLALLPEEAGGTSGPAAQALAAKLAGIAPTVQRYAAQPLPSGINGSYAVCRIGLPTGHWRYVIAAIVTGHPGALVISIPKSAKPAFADLPPLLASLHPTR